MLLVCFYSLIQKGHSMHLWSVFNSQPVIPLIIMSNTKQPMHEYTSYWIICRYIFRCVSLLVLIYSFTPCGDASPYSCFFLFHLLGIHSRLTIWKAILIPVFDGRFQPCARCIRSHLSSTYRESWSSVRERGETGAVEGKYGNQHFYMTGNAFIVVVELVH